MTRLLIDYGCEVNALSKTGESALHIAARRGRFDCTMVLLTNGAIANVKGADGNTPLHLAMKVGFSSAGCLLFQKGGAGAERREVHNIWREHTFLEG